ncbi:ACT domain-containing protein [Propioniciclava flava]
MSILVITVIGTDRAGLVSALGRVDQEVQAQDRRVSMV